MYTPQRHTRANVLSEEVNQRQLPQTEQRPKKVTYEDQDQEENEEEKKVEEEKRKNFIMYGIKPKNSSPLKRSASANQAKEKADSKQKEVKQKVRKDQQFENDLNG